MVCMTPGCDFGKYHLHALQFFQTEPTRGLEKIGQVSPWGTVNNEMVPIAAIVINEMVPIAAIAITHNFPLWL